MISVAWVAPTAALVSQVQGGLVSGKWHVQQLACFAGHSCLAVKVKLLPAVSINHNRHSNFFFLSRTFNVSAPPEQPGMYTTTVSPQRASLSGMNKFSHKL